MAILMVMVMMHVLLELLEHTAHLRDYPEVLSALKIRLTKNVGKKSMFRFWVFPHF